MITYLIIAGIAVIIVCLWLIVYLKRRSPKKLDKEHFAQRWSDLQKLCISRKTWPDAIIAADTLLCEALRDLKYKGKTTGERLVAAQHELSSNDTVWAGHKLRNTIGETDVRKLKKQDVLKALTGFRQALRDLGALDA